MRTAVHTAKAIKEGGNPPKSGSGITKAKKTCSHDYSHLRTVSGTDVFFCRKCLNYRRVKVGEK